MDYLEREKILDDYVVTNVQLGDADRIKNRNGENFRN